MALRADSTSSANAPSAKASAPKIALDRVSMSFERRGEPRLAVLQGRKIDRPVLLLPGEGKAQGGNPVSGILAYFLNSFPGAHALHQPVNPGIRVRSVEPHTIKLDRIQTTKSPIPPSYHTNRLLSPIHIKLQMPRICF